MVAQSTLHEPPTKLRWVLRCAMRLRERRPDLSRDEVLEQADGLWESDGFAQSPEDTADAAIEQGAVDKAFAIGIEAA